MSVSSHSFAGQWKQVNQSTIISLPSLSLVILSYCRCPYLMLLVVTFKCLLLFSSHPLSHCNCHYSLLVDAFDICYSHSHNLLSLPLTLCLVVVMISTHWLMHLTYAGKMVEACQKGSEKDRGCDCRYNRGRGGDLSLYSRTDWLTDFYWLTDWITLPIDCLIDWLSIVSLTDQLIVSPSTPPLQW